MLYVHYIAKCMWTGLAILGTHMLKQIFLFQHDKGLVILVCKGSTQQTRIHSLFKVWGVGIKLETSPYCWSTCFWPCSACGTAYLAINVLPFLLKAIFPFGAITLWITINHACLYFATKSDLSLLFLQEPINIITTILVSVAQLEHLKMVRTLFLI